MTPLQNSLLACPACRKSALRPFITQHRIRDTRFYSRPTTAPKPVLDLRHIRQNPGLYEDNCINRNYAAKSRNSWEVLELFNRWQQCQKQARSLREARNVNKRALSAGKGVIDIPTDKSKQELLEEARKIKEELADLEAEEQRCEEQMESLALELPNLSSNHTPTGTEPEVIGYINDHPEPPGSSSDRVWRSHVHIGSELDLLDFSAAGTTSGWGWYYLKNEAALLEQALIQFALAEAMKIGWKVVSPPSMVYAHMAAACGFQPRDQNGEQQIYAIEQPEKDAGKPRMVMAGTAEIPLAGLKSGLTIEENELPLKVIGVSRCYRQEAGARGAETKGLYRVHEFTKVEMFAWTLPDFPQKEEGVETGNFAIDTPSSSTTAQTSTQEEPSQSTSILQEMLSLQTRILKSLGLHCRILEMPTTDLGGSAARKLDIEAYFPSRRTLKSQGWGELSSLSLCTDYQTRRLATRVKMMSSKKENKSGGGGGRLDFPWTLNGTALAVPRVLACLLENGWDEARMAVRIPECLRGYLGGMTEIRASGDRLMH